MMRDRGTEKTRSICKRLRMSCRATQVKSTLSDIEGATEAPEG